MPFTSDEHQLPRRNARSFDLDDSATKAAAWVWHLHDSKPGVTTEGRFLSSQGRRRNSSSSGACSDRRGSRFRREAADSTRVLKAGGAKSETPMWDCGSNLYDTFELVAFGNRLDRSLMEAVIPAAPACRKAHVNPQERHTASPVDHEPARVLRTVSLSARSTAQSCQQRSKEHTGSVKANNTDRASLSNLRELSSSVHAQDPGSKRWPSVGKLMKAFKKVVDLHKQVGMSVGCKNSTNIVESIQRPVEPLHEDGDEGLMAKKVRSISHECVGSTLQNGLPPMQEGRMNTRRKSLDDGLLNARRRKDTLLDGVDIAKAQTAKPPMSQSHSYHKHLHHHHHHHHHHYLHHSLASQSARLSAETMSKISADKSWIAS